jgi:hypothetical protein
LRKDLRDEFESVPTIRRRVIVVMSDGLDAMGKKDQQKIQGLVNDIAGIALDEHIKVYTIGFSTIGQEGFVYLTQLSNKTDGAPRLLPDESGPSDIDGAWIELGEQLKRQYVVSFYPEDLDGGQTVKFQIKAEIGGANISTVAPMSTALGEKPFDWKLALIWTGSILGGLLFIFLIYKLIVGWMRRPPKAEPEVVMVETGPTGPTRGKLQITKGPCVGEIHYLTDDVTTIGSTDGNTIVLADPSVSKRHAGIKIEDLRYELADFGSTNKVYVNGRVITKQFLKDGDEIRLGDSEMVFSLK